MGGYTGICELRGRAPEGKGCTALGYAPRHCTKLSQAKRNLCTQVDVDALVLTDVGVNAVQVYMPSVFAPTGGVSMQPVVPVAKNAPDSGRSWALTGPAVPAGLSHSNLNGGISGASTGAVGSFGPYTNTLTVGGLVYGSVTFYIEIASTMFAASGALQIHDIAYTVPSTQTYIASSKPFSTGDWPVSGARFLFWNDSFSGAAMTPPGNDHVLEGACVVIAGTRYQLAFGGAAGATIPSGGWVWSDPLAQVIPANTTCQIIAASYTPTNSKRVGSSYPTIAQGEGISFGTTTRSGLLTTGTIGTTIATIGAFNAVTMAGTGWDGKPVALVLGASVTTGFGAQYTIRDARANRSGVQRFLDSTSGGGRIPFGMFSRAGSTMAAVRTAVIPKLAQICADIPNIPFTKIVSGLGLNDALTTTPADMLDRFSAYASAVQTSFPRRVLHPITLTPRTNVPTEDTIGFEANQTYATGFEPGGTADVFNAYLMSSQNPAGAALSSGDAVRGVDKNKWKVLQTNWTLNTAVPAGYYPNGAAGPTNILIDVPSGPVPDVGMVITFEPGTPNQDATDGVYTYYVGAVSNVGTLYTVSILRGLQQASGGLVTAAHAPGTAIGARGVYDWTHPATYFDSLLATQYLVEKPKIFAS